MSKDVIVAFKRLPGGEDLPLPKYQSVLAAGMDLYAAVKSDLVLAPGECAIVPTGFAIALPAGFEAQVRSRSGLAAKNGVAVLNAPGTIDADYRGEVGVILINHGKDPFTVTRGARIAQMVFAPVTTATFIETDTLPESVRGADGFGSTGHKT